jgi:ComF family protein
MDGATHPRCRTKYTIDGLTSFFRYEGVAKKAIKTIKYRFVSDLAHEFVGLIPDSFLNNMTIQQHNNCILIPIPLHPFRLRERGFNQAEVFGNHLSLRLHVPMKTDVIVRSKKTIPQVEMKDRNMRLKNMDNVFMVNNTNIRQYKHVFVIDDVFTTGATMRAAAGILKHHGVQSVWGITITR